MFRILSISAAIAAADSSPDISEACKDVSIGSFASSPCYEAIKSTIENIVTGGKNFVTCWESIGDTAKTVFEDTQFVDTVKDEFATSCPEIGSFDKLNGVEQFAAIVACGEQLPDWSFAIYNTTESMAADVVSGALKSFQDNCGTATREMIVNSAKLIAAVMKALAPIITTIWAIVKEIANSAANRRLDFDFSAPAEERELSGAVAYQAMALVASSSNAVGNVNALFTGVGAKGLVDADGNPMPAPKDPSNDDSDDDTKDSSSAALAVTAAVAVCALA